MTKKSPWPADKVERRSTAELVPDAKNARLHTPEQVAQIADAITEWGWTNPVLVDEKGKIIAGHGRVLAAQKLKLPDVPVMVARGWSEAKKRAYNLADNKLTLNAAWDVDALNASLLELRDEHFDLKLTGFSEVELARVFDDAATLELRRQAAAATNLAGEPDERMPTIGDPGIVTFQLASGSGSGRASGWSRMSA